MKALNNILNSIEIVQTEGNTAISVSSISFDSRVIEPGTLFVAQRGTRVDGHQFIDSCIERGATAIVCEEFPEKLRTDVCYILVRNSAKALGILASNYYNNPSSKLKLIGVTGTNGKTTTATLLYRLFSDLGYACGLLSTIGNKIVDKDIPSTHTTPDALQLNKLLSEMIENGCDYCFMEVSSHSVVQQRIAGLTFQGGIFSNITHDHLDFHKTFDEYIKAKKVFFDNLPKTAFALTNIDDRNGMVMLQNTKAEKHTYSLKSMADFKCKILENAFQGLHLVVDGTEIYTRLVGSFNAYNLLAVYATAILLNADREQVLTTLSTMNSVEGRFEYIRSQDDVTGIVDYAHTPDALQNVLSTIHNIRNGGESIITVVGCGGDRDAAKRPVMAKIACEMSEKVILTSDNPRSEEPEEILKEMMKGVELTYQRKVLSIVNRREAIKTANMLAQPGDIILVAGKGHEKYQEIKGVRHHFDDKEELAAFFVLRNQHIQ